MTRPYVSAESQRLKDALAETSRKIELREDVRKVLDATEQGLADNLREVVRQRQHNDGPTLVDVENARTKLIEFQRDRGTKEKNILDKIDESYAEK